MICKNCGTQLEPNAQFCPVCGAKAEDISAKAPEAAGMDSNSTSALIFGILSLFFQGILGIIFGAIAISKANAFTREYGVLCGNAKAGKVFGIIGLIISCIAAFAVVIYLVMIPVLISSVSGISTEIFNELRMF